MLVIDVGGTHVDVLPNADAMVRAAAEHFVRSAEESVGSRGWFAVALAGGSTPKSLYTCLATDPYAGRVDWARVQVFFGDERCVPPDNSESNYRMARQTLLDHVALPPRNLHRIHGEDDPAAAAAGSSSP